MKSDKPSTQLSQQVTRHDSPIRKMVVKKAKRLLRHGRLRFAEQEDIEQTIWLNLLKALKRFDPIQGTLAAYCNHVIDSAIANFLRHHAAEMRRCDEQISLSDLSSEIQELATSQDQDLDSQIDLANVFDQLPPDQHQICQQLSFHNKSKSARELGMSRTTLQTRIKQISKQLRQAGLEIYMQ